MTGLVGVATIAADGSVLDTWFPAPELGGDGVERSARHDLLRRLEDQADRDAPGGQLVGEGTLYEGIRLLPVSKTVPAERLLETSRALVVIHGAVSMADSTCARRDGDVVPSRSPMTMRLRSADGNCW